MLRHARARDRWMVGAMQALLDRTSGPTMPVPGPAARPYPVFDLDYADFEDENVEPGEDEDSD